MIKMVSGSISSTITGPTRERLSASVFDVQRLCGHILHVCLSNKETVEEGELLSSMIFVGIIKVCQTFVAEYTERMTSEKSLNTSGLHTFSKDVSPTLVIL